MDFSTAIGNTKTEDDETSHKTVVAEVTSVCDDHHNYYQQFEEDQEVKPEYENVQS